MDSTTADSEQDTTATDTNDPDSTDPPVEITESARDAAKEMAKAYEDRPTVVLPGSDGTVAGTAVNDWLDDDGKPKYGDIEKSDGTEQSGGADQTDDENS